MDTAQIKPNMTVVDTHDRKVGTVDQVNGDVLKLSRDGFSDNLHHFVPIAAVHSVDGDRVIVEPGVATTVEAITAALEYAHSHTSSAGGAIFGTSGHGTGFGGSGIGD